MRQWIRSGYSPECSRGNVRSLMEPSKESIMAPWKKSGVWIEARITSGIDSPESWRLCSQCQSLLTTTSTGDELSVDDFFRPRVDLDRLSTGTKTVVWPRFLIPALHPNPLAAACSRGQCTHWESVKAWLAGEMLIINRAPEKECWIGFPHESRS